MTDPKPEDRLSRDERIFASEVRRLRDERGWSQAVLAEQLRAQGIDYASQATISRIENGTRFVRIAEAIAIAHLFDRPLKLMLDPGGRELQLQIFREMAEQALDSYKTVSGLMKLVLDTQSSVPGLHEQIARLFPDDSTDADDRGEVDRVQDLLDQVLQADLRQLLAMHIARIAVAQDRAEESADEYSEAAER